MNIRLFRNGSCAVLLGVVLLVPLGAFAEKVEENPGAGRMAADLLVARPIGIVAFGLGTVGYILTLPFSLLGGNTSEAGEQLVVSPAREAFVRCIGCATAGRKEAIRE
jgi:hypothetical protein